MVLSDISFDYGIPTNLAIDQTYIEPEGIESIKVKAPLRNETKHLVRGRYDYQKLLRQLDSTIVDSNSHDISAAVIEVTYVNDDLSYLTDMEKSTLMTTLSSFRLMGVSPLYDIVDPLQVDITFDVAIILLDFTTATEVIDADLGIIFADFHKILESSVEYDQFEYLIENADYVKRARVTLAFNTWVGSTAYSRGNHVEPIAPNNYIYEATIVVKSKASCDLTAVAGSAIINDEGFTLTTIGNSSVVFKFSVDAGAVTGEDVTISINSADTPDQVAAAIQATVDSHADFEASAVANIVTIDQAEGGLEGNKPNSETVADGGFTVDNFTGGVNTGNSGSGEPTWPTVLGDTVVDGAITWTCRNPLANPVANSWNEYYSIAYNLTLSL